MLILTRRSGESIMMRDSGKGNTHHPSIGTEMEKEGGAAQFQIGKNQLITIKVLRVQGNQISIGIMAPDYIEIFREEVLQRIQNEENPSIYPDEDEEEGYYEE